mmetsp:Transcript_7333/g.26684  ORF Transcript_7333/g.26684 Transcript_7333/m.26684 type:complete len:207 (+) Transcript_7333:410-1030(+)
MRHDQRPVAPAAADIGGAFALRGWCLQLEKVVLVQGLALHLCAPLLGAQHLLVVGHQLPRPCVAAHRGQELHLGHARPLARVSVFPAGLQVHHGHQHDPQLVAHQREVVPQACRHLDGGAGRPGVAFVEVLALHVCRLPVGGFPLRRFPDSDEQDVDLPDLLGLDGLRALPDHPHVYIRGFRRAAAAVCRHVGSCRDFYSASRRAR